MKSKKGHLILKVKRKLLVMLCFAIAILFAIGILGYTIVIMADKYSNDFRSSVHSIRKQYLNTQQMDCYYSDSMSNIVENIANYTAYHISKHGYNSDTCLTLYDELGNNFLGFIFKGSVDNENQIADGELYSLFNYNEAATNAFLTPSHLYELISNGSIISGELNRYSCTAIDDDTYLILYYSFNNYFFQQSILTSYSSDTNETLCRINSDTMIIEDSNDSSIISADFEEIVTDKENIEKLDSDKISWLTDKDGNLLLVFVCKELDGMYIIEYIPVNSFLSLFFRRCAIPLILTCTFIFFILTYCLMYMHPHNEEKKKQLHYMGLFGRIYTEGRLLSHITAITILSMLIVISATLYVQTLINYCNQNVNAKRNLNTLKMYTENAEENAFLMTEDFGESWSLVTDILADYYLKYPDEVTDDNLEIMLNRFNNITSISILDNTGTIVSDTDARNGYTVSSDTSSAEYVCWDVINGTSSYGAYLQGSGYFILSRRQDALGAIRIDVVNDYTSYIVPFNQLCTIEEQEESVNFGDSYKGYVEKDDTATLYLMSPDNLTASRESEIIEDEVTLSDTSFLYDDYSGIRKLGLSRFIVNIEESDEYYLFSALSLGSLNGESSIQYAVFVSLAFLAELIVMIFLNIRMGDDLTTYSVIKIIDNKEEINEPVSIKIMDDGFRKLFRNTLIITCIVVVALLIFDSIFDNTSILSYIFESTWPKGFNLFSVTMILITFVLGLLASRFIQWSVIFFTENMGPRGLTIGRVLCSFIRFLTLIIVIVLVLVDLGVDYKTLLAGAGIAGVAITVCAQSSISDILMGFLIVFENLFNIGDWLTVNDFRGQVIDIGLRTTQLQISNTVRIINNSELKEVTKMERNGQGCVVLIDIAYKEDANKVLELLRNSTERYQNDIPMIQEGPFIDGIVDLSSSGVTLYIWAITELEVIKATEREIRRVTKNIFDENHIEIPFTQITLHQADEIAHFKGIKQPDNGSESEE